MSEYVYGTDEHQGHWLTGEEIVRCRDCKHADEVMTRYAGLQYACMKFDDATVEPDGFCAWGERAENFTTCKCGEDVELGNRESAVCPRCKRTVRA